MLTQKGFHLNLLPDLKGIMSSVDLSHLTKVWNYDRVGALESRAKGFASFFDPGLNPENSAMYMAQAKVSPRGESPKTEEPMKQRASQQIVPMTKRYSATPTHSKISERQGMWGTK